MHNQQETVIGNIIALSKSQTFLIASEYWHAPTKDNENI